MAPRKAAASSSSKSPERSSAAKQNESSAAAKKRKAATPPPVSAPALSTVYVLIKSEGYAPDGFHSYQPPTNSMKGVYYSEDDAYAAAIRKIISDFEPLDQKAAELRKIATTKGLPLKERMEKIRATSLEIYGGDESRIHVKKSRLFPTGIVDDGKLLDGLKPKKRMYSDFDYQSDGAASSTSSDGWDIPY